MLTYERYIARSIFGPLFILTFVLTSLVWITQILKFLYLIDKGIKLKHFLELIILIIPSLLFMILPVVAVLAVIYAYNKLQDDRQLVILRSSGLSNWKIAKPALLVISILTLFSYYISAYLMPLSYNKLKQELNYLKENYVSKIIDVRTFNQVSKNVTIYVDKKKSDGIFEGIILFNNKVPENKTVLFAETGEFLMKEQKPVLELKHGLRQSYDQAGNLSKLYFDDLTIEIEIENNYNSTRRKTNLELYIHEMLWPDMNLPIEKQKRLITEGHQRIIWPLYNYAFVFLALSQFLSQSYNRKSNIKQIVITFFPVVLVAYFHFTLQKLAYKDGYFIFLCYANVFLSIIFSIWQSNKNTL